MKSKRARFIPTLVFSLAAGLGVYLAIPAAAIGEKCNPNDPGTCTGGPTGPGDKVCGRAGNACCEDYDGNSFCDPGTGCFLGKCEYCVVAPGAPGCSE